MDSIGAEVGQKMRSAIKAKLLELDCYVDEELPDYIMVMVANKRSKSQMNEDLRLFLASKTSVFVEWLHIVLEKLREVTVTNPEVYRKVIKPCTSEIFEEKFKKEKIQSNTKPKKEKDETEVSSIQESKFLRARKVSLVKNKDNFDDNFDIPLLSEVNVSTQEDLDELEKKIRNVKSRLGILMESYKDDGIEENQLQGNIELVMTDENKTEEKNEEKKNYSSIQDAFLSEKRRHTPITFDLDVSKRSRKRSVLDRLGRRISDHNEHSSKRFRRNTDSDKDEDVLTNRKNRFENSKVDHKEACGNGNDISSRKGKKVASSIVFENRKDKNKSALSRLGVLSKVSVPHKDLSETEPEDQLRKKDVRSVVQVKPRVIPSDIPQPSKNLLLKAVAEAQKSIEQSINTGNWKNSVKSNIANEVPIAHCAIFKKNKDRCKYWPNSRQGDKYEFVHSMSSCESFPHCKYGERCIFRHPSCKFGTACTKKECPFDHSSFSKVEGTRSFAPIKMSSTVQVCKYYPKCSNLTCPFYHPKICAYGKYCRNQAVCGFFHPTRNINIVASTSK